MRYWLAAALLFSLPIYIQAKENPQSQSVYPFAGKINGNKVRLRSAPHLESTIIGELHKDDYVQIIGEQAGFYVVAPPANMKMYVYRTYVFDQTVDANNVNVRLAPSLEAPIAAQLHAGDKVVGKPSSQNPKWLEIDPPVSAKLYVAKDYVVNMGDPSLLNSPAKEDQSAPVESYKEVETITLSPDLPLDIAPLTSWNSLEQNFQSQWLAHHTEATVDDFHKAEEKISLRGIIEPYKASSKNAPGDFLLLVNGVPAAFLYSPYVDLSVAAGKEISLTAVVRSNNHYAYPAYCVLQMKHGNS